MLKKVLLLFSILVLTVALTVAQDPPKPLKIGFVADQTGIGYLFAQSQLAGLQIAVSEINAAGGILGRPIEFIIRDAQLKPDVGATIARQMILEDGVELLLGPTSSSVALALAEIAKEYKIPLALHTSNTVALTTTNFNPFIVQLVPHTTIEARAAARYAGQLDYKTWGTIGPDYSFGRDSFNAFQPMLAEMNPEATIVSEQWPKLAERDLTPYISALQANPLDAIYSNLWGDQFVTFMQQAAPLGLFEDSQFVGLMDMDFMKAIGADLPEGLIGYSRAPFYGIEGEAIKTFVEKHKRLTAGQYPSDWAIMIYDAVYALKAAVEKAGTTDGEAVAAAFDDLTFTSLRGELTIRACDHMANVGEYVGKTAYVDEYPFPILVDVVYVPAEEVWDSCEDIEAMRNK